MSQHDERLKEIPGKFPTPLELGVSGWNVLHTSAAVYPYQPSEVQQKAMKSFIESWAHVYACSWCAYHMRDYVQKNPPDVRDKISVSRYVCELHNEVNGRLDKPLFDCSPAVVLRRWHPGYPDKMEDKPTIEEQLAISAKKKAEAAAAKRTQQEQEERRFSDFGLATRGSVPREPAGWRERSAGAAVVDNEGKINDNGKSSRSSKRWWFFGSSAFSAAPTSSISVAEVPKANAPPLPGDSGVSNKAVVHPPADPAGSGSVASGWNWSHFPEGRPTATLSQTPSRTKASDDETDVDAVLERLKRCQVYCPEDEDLLKH